MLQDMSIYNEPFTLQPRHVHHAYFWRGALDRTAQRQRSIHQRPRQRDARSLLQEVRQAAAATATATTTPPPTTVSRVAASTGCIATATPSRWASQFFVHAVWWQLSGEAGRVQ
jgi:hypothetical protein